MDIYAVIAVEDCFFQTVEKSSKLRLSAEQVVLNYAPRSPWSNGSLLYRQDAESLALWHHKQPAADHRRVQIPEGYLLARPFLDRSAAILYYKKPTSGSYTVVKQGRLVAQLSFPAAIDAEQGVEARIKLLEREYSLINPEIVHLAETDLPTPTWRDLKDFLRFGFDRKLAIKSQLWLKNAAIAVLTVSALYSLFNYIYFQRLVEQQSQQLAGLQHNNSGYRERLRKIAAEAEFWDAFQREQLGQGTWLAQMDRVAEIIQSQDGYFKMLRFSGRELTLQIGLPGAAPELVKQLLATGMFAEAKIVSTRKDRDAPAFHLINMRLMLKPATEKTSG